MLILLLFIFGLLLLQPGIASLCVVETSKTWLYKLVPILYPNFILIDLLIQNEQLEKTCVFFYPAFQKIFHIRYPKSTLILIMSMICGAPASTKLIKNALEHEEIDNKEANALFYSCSCFSLPYTIYIFNLFQINVMLYLILYLLSIILILWIGNKGKPNQNDFTKKRKDNILSSFFSSISKNIDILVSILGIMIFFNIILSLLKIDLRLFSYFEVLNGHSILKNLELLPALKTFILITSLGFLGLSVHLQILFIYPKLNYMSFFFIKLFQSLSIGALYLLFSFLF